MAKYLIHAVPKRMWYVRNYLYPSMLEQGIEESDISIYNDIDKLGNLKACLHAFKTVPYDDYGTWHLQDDVILSRDFKEKTEQYDSGIVCGFCSYYDDDRPYGPVNLKNMWFSFPCIRIPNKIANDCSDWVSRYIIGNRVYKEFWIRGTNDDWAFRAYLNTYYKQITATNLNPNIVNHIDYLIGGTVKGKDRETSAVSRFWEEDELISDLERRLIKNHAL